MLNYIEFINEKIMTNTFTHEGSDYNLYKLNGLVRKNKIQSFPVKDLVWIFKYDDPTKDHPERIGTANINVPILVTKTKDGLVVLDGLHRLAKAVLQDIKELKGKLVNKEDLEKVKVKNE